MSLKDDQLRDILSAIREAKYDLGKPRSVVVDTPGLSEAIMALSVSVDKLAAAFLDAKEDVT